MLIPYRQNAAVGVAFVPVSAQWKLFPASLNRLIRSIAKSVSNVVFVKRNARLTLSLNTRASKESETEG